jgi:virginiamycin B lyase
MRTLFNHGPTGTLSSSPFNKDLDSRVLALSALLVFSAAQMFAQTPKINEYPVPTANFSGLQGITAGPDGALWFCEYASPSATSKIGRITTAGFLTEYTVPAGSAGFPGVLEIHAGADGALWFTEFIANQIGRITTAGVITEFTVPTTDSRPTEITAGPDGALWFTENSGNKIGRITMAGVITEFSVPTVNSWSTGITPGPDGALWFAEFNSNKIGRITTAGVITEFPIPTANSGPNVVTAGPDNALWFTEYNAKQIGRITTAGVITEYPVPTATSPPNRIAAGSDGALWFTEVLPLSSTNTSNISDKIGRITTTAIFTEYTVPTPNSGTNDITLGPDGALWFTEYSGNQIGQVQPIATGTINVTSTPSGAGFILAGPGLTNISQTTPFTLANATPGDWTITWDILLQPYLNPPSETKTLPAGGNIAFKGIYTPITLSACPTLSPRCSQTLSFSFQQGVAGPISPQQVAVTSNGPSVGFSVLSTSTPINWLSVTIPPNAMTPATLTVDVIPDKSLKAGMYSGTISISSGGATNSPQVLSVILTVTKGPPPPPSGFMLSFPVPSDGACNGVCTPNSAPINAIFDHQMLNAYEAPLKKNKQGNCTPVPTPANWGTIVDFLGEAANVQPTTKGYGNCHDLFGYQSTAHTSFLQDVTYNDNVLWYDSHPGYDYNFGFGTKVFAAVSGCISYALPPAHVLSAASFHVLTIIPSSSEPAGGCGNAPLPDGYLVYYLHLSSFFDLGQIKKGIKPLSGSGVPSGIIPCPECPAPNTWVAANAFVGYSGNYSSGWGGVGAHLHFEVDLKNGSTLTPVDPYGWNPLDHNQVDPYSTTTGVVNTILWNNFVP